MIYLLYQSPWPVGGSTSYTVHLAKVLGDKCCVLRLGKRTESQYREIQDTGVKYQIVEPGALHSLFGPILLTASNPKLDENLWARLGKMSNVWATFHDPNEFALYPHWKHFSHRRVVCIRETGLAHMPHGRFIPHPYWYLGLDSRVKRTKHAISIARTSSVKRSQIIMEANRSLPARLRVALLGEPNRMWFAHYVRHKYPEVTVSAGYPRKFGAGVTLCAAARYMVDLTTFKQDGGGTQYTFLEAMDGGAVPIMSSDWCSYAGPAYKFGPHVSTAAELVQVLRRGDGILEQQVRNWSYLETVHNPDAIRKQYLSTLK